MSTPMKAFVLMPFHPEFDELYSEVIKPALEDVGYAVSRADSPIDQQNILKHIVQAINEADLIIAELTTSNANVLYELGFCHGLDKPTVMLSQSMDDVPFDLRQYTVQLYDTDFRRIGELKARLSEIGAQWRDRGMTFDNPRSDFIASPLPLSISRRDSRTPPETEGEEPGDEADEREEEDEADEGEEEGLLDFAHQGEQALGRTTRFFLTLTEDTQKLGEILTSSTAEADQLGQSPEPGSASRMHKLALRVAGAMNAYSQRVEEALPDLDEGIREQFRNTTAWVQLAQPASDEDIGALRKLRSTVAESLAANRANLEATRGFRESVSGLRQAGISKAMSGASRRLCDNLDRVIAVLEEVEPLGQRLLRAIDSKFASAE